MLIIRLPGIDFVLAISLHLFSIVFPATSITQEKYVYKYGKRLTSTIRQVVAHEQNCHTF